MARIPKNELEELKTTVSVQRLAEQQGIKLIQHGKELLGLCPFHADSSPSLVINPSKNLWHCMGACQVGGDVISWVQKTEGVSFRQAVELLREGLVGGDGQETVSLESPFAGVTTDAEALARAVEYYHSTLLRSPEALEYLASRGIHDEEAIRRFQLGYCDRTLGLQLPSKSTKDGGEIRGRLQRVGVLRTSGHEHFRGCLTIPVVDVNNRKESGAVLEVYGRKIRHDLRKGSPHHLYLPGPHRGVWNVAEIVGNNDVILCESLIDALTFWCAGFHNVTTSYGVEGFGQEHLEVLRKSRVNRILIAYDNDEAGDSGAVHLAKRLGEEEFACFRVKFPSGKDANGFCQKVHSAELSLGRLLDKAEWMAGPRLGALRDYVAEPEETAEPVEPQLSEEPPVVDEETAASPLAAETNPAANGDHNFTHGDRQWRIRGLDKNQTHEQLKVNIMVRKNEGFHVDTLDLYSAKHRSLFIKQTARELAVEERVVKNDLGQILLKLEAFLDKHIRTLLEPQKPVIHMSEQEREEALLLLKEKDLLGRILRDFEHCGVVGEETNKLVGYLAAVSRKLDEPLAIIIQSSSAAGKSSLMESILSFVPEEERSQYSAMTGQSLFYLGETDLKHKVLAIAEEEGAEKASYALKLLQSEGFLTIASTGKDPQSGRMITQEYRVEGPVMIFLTTTAIEVDEELLNRCILLTVDEEREQTRAIHRLQRERQTLGGLLVEQDRSRILKLHQNAQRLLRPLLVANPFAEKLTFLDHQTRTRRDHMKYLTLIRTIAFLHQYQREIKTANHQGKVVQYIEVTLDDIAMANKLAHEVLGRSLDELPPQTRRLLHMIDQMVTERCINQGLDRSDVRFTRREVREFSGFGNTQLKMHMHRLEELEYLLVHRGGRGQCFVHELVCEPVEGEDGRPFLPGLLDVRELREEFEVAKPGEKLEDESREKVAATCDRSGGSRAMSVPNRGRIAPESGTSQNAKNGKSAKGNGELKSRVYKLDKKALFPGTKESAPYVPTDPKVPPKVPPEQPVETSHRSGASRALSPPNRPQIAAESGPSQKPKIGKSTKGNGELKEQSQELLEKPLFPGLEKSAPYVVKDPSSSIKKAAAKPSSLVAKSS